MLTEVELVKRPLADAIERVAAAAEERLRLMTPFISASATERIIGAIDCRREVTVDLITRPSLDALAEGTCEIAALKLVAARGQLGNVFDLSRLHAKVYTADQKMALVTSANLTRAGLWRHQEYGVLVSGAEAVRAVCRDVDGMTRMAHPLSLVTLTAVEEHLAALAPRVRARQVESVEPAAAAIMELLGLPSNATSVHDAFKRAVAQVLSEQGPLKTQDLHPHIQRLLPALCDDSLDRICGGEHYGKLWKHQVRNAQSDLKRNGTAELRTDGTWSLVT